MAGSFPYLDDDKRRKDHMSAYSRDVLRETERLTRKLLIWTAAFVAFGAIAVLAAALT